SLSPNGAARWRLVAIMRALLEEQLPVRPLDTILEEVIREPRSAVVDVAERIRSRVRDRLTTPGAGDEIIEMSDAEEATIERGIRTHGPSKFLVLEPDAAQEMLTRI